MQLLTALTLALGFTACSDNEKDEPRDSSVAEVVGEYVGTMACTAMGTDLNFDDVAVTVTAADDNNVDITVDAFGNPPMRFSALKITGVTVSGNQLVATEFSGTAADGKNYSGALQGELNGKLSLNLTVTYGAMPFPLVCNYSGEKK